MYILMAASWHACLYVCASVFIKADRIVNPGLFTDPIAGWLASTNFPQDPWLGVIISFAGCIAAAFGHFALSVRRLRDIGVPVLFVVVYPIVLVSGLMPYPANWPYAYPSPATLMWDTLLLLVPGQQRVGALR